MYYNDGVDRAALVSNAAYRACLANQYKQESSNDKYKYGFWVNGSTAGLHYINNGTNTGACRNITDAMLNSCNNIPDAYTADYNTGLLESTSDAAKHCRSILIFGQRCSIPNIRQLIRIYCDADFIDAHDSSLASYPAYKLSGWPCAGGGNGDVHYAWTCVNTEGKHHGCYAVYQNGCCNFIYGFHGYPRGKAMVIPILELAA